jgi:hypothetical protein
LEEALTKGKEALEEAITKIKEARKSRGNQNLCPEDQLSGSLNFGENGESTLILDTASSAWSIRVAFVG